MFSLSPSLEFQCEFRFERVILMAFCLFLQANCILIDWIAIEPTNWPQSRQKTAVSFFSKSPHVNGRMASHLRSDERPKKKWTKNNYRFHRTIHRSPNSVPIALMLKYHRTDRPAIALRVRWHWKPKPKIIDDENNKKKINEINYLFFDCCPNPKSTNFILYKIIRSLRKHYWFIEYGYISILIANRRHVTLWTIQPSQTPNRTN